MTPRPVIPMFVIAAWWTCGPVAHAAPDDWRRPEPLGLRDPVDAVSGIPAPSPTLRPERLLNAYVERSVRVTLGQPMPWMQLHTGTVTSDVGPRLSDLADLLPATRSVPILVPRLDDGREHAGVGVALGLVSGVLLTAASGLWLPNLLPLLALDRLRLGVAGAAMAVAGEWCLASLRPPGLARVGRLVDAVNDDVARALLNETSPSPPAETVALLDLYKRSVIHHLALPTGGDALWRNGELLDAGPARLRLPELVGDVPAAHLAATAYVRDLQRGVFWETASVMTLLSSAAAALGAVFVGGPLLVPLLTGSILGSVVALVGSLVGSIALSSAREGFRHTLDVHHRGLVTRVGAGLVLPADP